MKLKQTIYNYSNISQNGFVERLCHELHENKINAEIKTDMIVFSSRKESLNYQNKSIYNAIKPPLIGTVKTEKTDSSFNTTWYIKNEGILIRFIIFLLFYSFVNYLLGYDLWSNILKCLIFMSIIFGTYMYGMKSRIKKIARKLRE
jgi:hypothetical protein